MSTFYDTKGNSISKEEFIETYSNIYYYLNDIKTEKKIERMLYENASISAEDVVCFIRWKVGDKEKKDTSIKTQRGRTINIEEVKEMASEIGAFGKSRTPEELYRKVFNKRIDGMGAVYNLSLVYLITKGKEPLYDRFAYIAISVILDDLHGFRVPYQYNEMPNKDCVNTIMLRYNGYKNKLNRVFGDEWKKNRDIDRALWTYGHMFSG